MNRFPKVLRRKARQGFRGYPVGTIAFYGPDESTATKVAVGILAHEGAPADPLERWLAEQGDVRADPEIGRAVLEYLREHQVKSVVMADRLLGCPHEEGIDYPEGEVCPECPFWADRDRWSGERVH